MPSGIEPGSSRSIDIWGSTTKSPAGFTLVDSAHMTSFRSKGLTVSFHHNHSRCKPLRPYFRGRPSSEPKRNTPTKNKKAKPMHIANHKFRQKSGNSRMVVNMAARTIAKPMDATKVIFRKTRRSRYALRCAVGGMEFPLASYVRCDILNLPVCGLASYLASSMLRVASNRRR